MIDLDGSIISIDELRKLYEKGSVRWTVHALERLQERGIKINDIKHAIMFGKIIEQYPMDYPYPSCLVFGIDVLGGPIHVVCGIGGGFMWIISAYRPDSDDWEPDFETRKVKK